ncbi:MAG: phosphoribosylamine--glycine ligase [Candidatus Woesearchaeota archaeon]
MKVLIVGSGGREHALAWKIAKSPLVSKVYCAPGNDGILQTPKADCFSEIKATDIEGLVSLAKKKGVDFTLFGPEDSLVNGAYDRFRKEGRLALGPDSWGADIEGSKAWTKDLMQNYGIPTAFGQSTSRISQAKDIAKEFVQHYGGVVVKADGPCGGKGVFVCRTLLEAILAIDRIMVKRVFGPAGKRVVLEELLVGEEASFMALVNSVEDYILPFASSQDHKRRDDGDKGPMTGGMGAYSPAPVVTPVIHKMIMKDTLYQTMRAMAQEGRPYVGVMYAGLMIVKGKPKVLEFNCRFGDPEIQPILMRMKPDIMPLLIGCAEGNLRKQTVEWYDDAAVCVVMASKGYPESEQLRGQQIHGLEDVTHMENVYAFHAGTAYKNGVWTNKGGRVLGVTGRAPTIKEAQDLAYEAAKMITFNGAHYRTDIGNKAIQKTV